MSSEPMTAADRDWIARRRKVVQQHEGTSGDEWAVEIIDKLLRHIDTLTAENAALREQLYAPVLEQPWKGEWEIRDCATLGTGFADIYRDGELWAMQVGRSLAESFVRDPRQYSGNAFAATPMLRTWAMEMVIDSYREQCIALRERLAEVQEVGEMVSKLADFMLINDEGDYVIPQQPTQEVMQRLRAALATAEGEVK